MVSGPEAKRTPKIRGAINIGSRIQNDSGIRVRSVTLSRTTKTEVTVVGLWIGVDKNVGSIQRNSKNPNFNALYPLSNLVCWKIITNNDNFGGTVKADNVVRHLLAAGRTWKSYEEDLPYPGYLKPDVGNYARRHCPMSYLSEVINSSTQILNLVPFTQFATDLASGRFADYSFITPNLCNDAHDCSLATADAWLKTNIDPLIQSSSFQNGGLLIIVFDESASDNTRGGGRVAWVAVSPEFSKAAYQSTMLYQHQSTLRLMMQGLGLTTYPGKAKSAANMAELFR